MYCWLNERPNKWLANRKTACVWILVGDRWRDAFITNAPCHCIWLPSFWNRWHQCAAVLTIFVNTKWHYSLTLWTSCFSQCTWYLSPVIQVRASCEPTHRAQSSKLHQNIVMCTKKFTGLSLTVYNSQDEGTWPWHQGSNIIKDSSCVHLGPILSTCHPSSLVSPDIMVLEASSIVLVSNFLNRLLCACNEIHYFDYR